MVMLGKPEPWMALGLCREVDTGDMFFPEKGNSTADAKRICVGCEIRERCLEFAMANDERFGVWGGYSERERRRLQRGEEVPLIRKSVAPPRLCHECGGEYFGAFNSKYCGQACRSVALCRVRKAQQSGRRDKRAS
jgi:WhiB family redox-sensing transcriptional regulator